MLNSVSMVSIYGLGVKYFRFLCFGFLSLQHKICRLKRHACRIDSAQRSYMWVKSTYSQATCTCNIKLDVNIIFGLVQKQNKNIQKLLSLHVCIETCHKHELCLEDVPKGSIVTYIIKTGLFDFINCVKYIPKHV